MHDQKVNEHSVINAYVCINLSKDLFINFTFYKYTEINFLNLLPFIFSVSIEIWCRYIIIIVRSVRSTNFLCKTREKFMS